MRQDKPPATGNRQATDARLRRALQRPAAPIVVDVVADPDLADVVKRWPKISRTTRRALLDLSQCAAAGHW